MKKPIRIFSFMIVLVLAIPIFKTLCEKFKACEILQVYTIISESDQLFEGMTFQ